MAFHVENPEISVIVPIYNVGGFVKKCMETLAQQTVKVPYEVIAVDDGSTDESPAVLAELEARFPCIQVLRQENAGVSAARQSGLSAARGTFICFVDGDDYVAPSYLERLYYACVDHEADISCCSYLWHFVSTDLVLPYPFRGSRVMDTEKGLRKLIHDRQIQSFLWGKMIKKELILASGIVFPKMCFEDLAVLHRIFARAGRVVLINHALYYYNIHSASTLGTMNREKICDYLRAVAMVREGLLADGLYGEYGEAYEALAKKSCHCCWWNVLRLHLNHRCFRGIFANVRRLNEMTRLVMSPGFDPERFYAALPGMIVAPPEKKSWLQKDYSVH